MTDLEWACRNYCDALYRIEKGDIDAEDKRITAHNKIEELTGERFEYILHNLNKFNIIKNGEYYYFNLARLLQSKRRKQSR